MDKKIINAVAGSGKTTYIIDNLNSEERFLLITYTENNTENIRRSVIKKFGYLPENISIYTFFTFLYNFSIKPQENCIKCFNYWKRSRGIDFITKSSDLPNWLDSRKRSYYLNDKFEYYSFRMSKLIVDSKLMFDYLKERIEKYFDKIFIDEVQDFSAHDYDLLLKMSEFDVSVTLLGDFYQHTYATSIDGNKNINLYKDYKGYKLRFKKMFEFDETTLVKSYRCSKNLCEFVENKLKINMKSHREDDIEIKEIFDFDEIKRIISDDKIVKLFYKSHETFGLINSDNWGNSKGSTFNNVCVVINPTTYKKYKQGKLHELRPYTLRKLYVAITRAKDSLYFIEQEKIKRIQLNV